MSETLLRQWAMLRHMPREPRKIDAATLQHCLREEGFRVDLRSVQRDLKKLSRVFPLLLDQRNRPYGWSWAREARHGFGLPAMEVPAAAAFRLLEAIAERSLPQSLRDCLSGYFRAADRTVSWDASGCPPPVRIVMAARGDVPRLPEPDLRVITRIYECLVRGRQCRARWMPPGPEAAGRSVVLAPLGLLLYEGVPYVVAVSVGDGQVAQYPLHRLQEADILDDPGAPPPGFDFDDWVREHYPFTGSGRQVRVDLEVQPLLAEHLAELPLGADQQVEMLADRRARLRATVDDDAQLRTWLLRHAGAIRINGPEALRREVADTAAVLVNSEQ